MSRQDSVKDRRKYQRVLVEPSSKILSVTLVGYGKTLVFDMSYEGAALAQPREKKVSDVEKDLVLHLQTEIDEATINAKSVRVNQEVVAVQFDEISVPARVIIDRVVTDRIVGLNTMLIDPKHYSGKSDFSFWFHGPKDTNLYLWVDAERLVKAQMEMANAAMVFEDDMLLFENKSVVDTQNTLNNQQIVRKVQAIIEQMDSDLPAFVEFKKLVADHVEA
jgi:hypothetical protein